MSLDLTPQELAIIEKWRRQYGQRRLVTGILGAIAVVMAFSGLLLVLRVVSFLVERGVPWVDILTFDWFEYVGTATSTLLFALLMAFQALFISAGVATILMTLFRVNYPRYRLLEKLLHRL
jgi:hypothetical protein